MRTILKQELGKNMEQLKQMMLEMNAINIPLLLKVSSKQMP